MRKYISLSGFLLVAAFFLWQNRDELLNTKFVQLDFPKPNQVVSSPLEVRGEARGNWFFEASFSVFLEDQYGNRFAQSIAQAQSDWMTENFVPFKATLLFDPTKPYDMADPESFKKTVEEFKLNKTIKAFLILRKGNPSGLPEYDDQVEIPVRF